MKIGKKIFVGIYVCLFALTITLSGVIIGFSALNGDFLSQFQMNYYTTPEILSDDYGYYVEMGEYPQTFAGYVSDVSFTDSREDFTYIAKDGSTATADIYTDGSGNRYIQYTVAAYSTDYTFLDGTATASGDAYFKLEPIKWRILGYYEDGAHTNGVTDSESSFVQVTEVSNSNYNTLVAHCDAIVVHSELGLEGVAWNNTETDVDYPDSAIYKWLENFYSTILANYDSYISYQTIDYNDTGNTSSSEYDTAALTTSEKIWLLSYTEAMTYYSNTTSVSSDRLCSPSDFGLATYIYTGTNYTSNYRTGTCQWWLRSSFLDSSYFYARFVGYAGNFYYYHLNSVYIYNAVRPAMLLNLSSDDDSGSGSVSTVEILSDSYGYYIEMGEYPQTFAGYVSDVSFTDSGEDFTYVAKDGTTATADVYIDGSGNRYIQYTVAAYSTSYTFVDGTATASGDAYFKLEPIMWRVLGYYEDSAYTNALVDGMAILVQITSVSEENYNALVAHSDAIVVQSELALEAVQWYTSNSDVDYPDSTIYNWLNAFYSIILSGYDSYISSRTIDYNDTSATSSSDYDTAAMITSEKIWLLSYIDANGVFYSSSTARLCSPSDFGLATYIYMNTNDTTNYRTGTCYWWLRSSFLSSSTYYARGVNYYGLNYAYVGDTGNGIRPALLLNLSGTGTSATATSVSSAAGMGSVSKAILTSTAHNETAILTTASVSEKRRLVLCVEN